MPTYEYQCKACGHTFEEFQSMTADPLVVCPNCGKSSLKRLMAGGAGMIFKGSGFYLTDYKKTGSSGTPAAKKTPDDKKKTDSKPSSDSAKPSKSE